MSIHHHTNFLCIAVIDKELIIYLIRLGINAIIMVFAVISYYIKDISFNRQEQISTLLIIKYLYVLWID